ncbi:unnamed protein product [Arabidopsis arenosa]|uniref:Uncharacterized protein n=1 Tax=Arabidopsis arenosa TaxID=38785 RepID=A0A8S2AND8_ARAAE|nr:unnamed protein product [Arabidopsis arenosa]
MPFPATPPAEMYLAIQLPNPISILVNYLLVSQTPIEKLRHLVNASDVNAIVMDEFMTWPHFVQPDSPFHAYFSLFLDRGAIPAIYLEGLRQANNFLTVAHGLTLLNSVAPSDPYACFANGLFLTCTEVEMFTSPPCRRIENVVCLQRLSHRGTITIREEGCRLFKKHRIDHFDYFEWFNEGVVDGWPKEALIRARDQIGEKDKVINQLTTQLMELRLELEKHEVEISSEGSEDENNFVTDHNDYFEWFDKGVVDGWPKETLIRARNEIREKDKVINQLTTQLMELRLELEKHEVDISSEGSEDENKSVESDHKSRTDHSDYLEWFDKGVVDGWPKETLIRARDEIREKDKVINQLTTQLMELRLELEKHEVEISSEGSEDENKSVESDHKRRNDHNDYFEWFDKGVVDGWPKETLIRARDEIREKDKIINNLTTHLMELRLELEKHEVEISSEGSEDENNSVTDHIDYFGWFDKGVVDGWPKETLIRARDEIREKDKVIIQLTTQLMELRLKLEKHEVEISSEGSEDENNSVTDHSDYFEWFDKGVVDGWPKETLIRARDEIREKDKVINHLTTQLMELRLELEKHEVEISSEGSEDENNSVTDHSDYFEWFDRKGVDGWPKETLIRARDEIREKYKVINQLTTQLMELRLELEKHEVEISSEGSEDENNSVESDHKRRTDHNDYFEWFDKGVVDGWPKETLTRARNEIREKDKVINHLTTQLMELRLELEKHEVEISSEGSEDENNSVTDHNDYLEWFDKKGVDGWPKETLIRARDEIREKDKVIIQLTTQLMELRLELKKHEVEISSEGVVDGWPKETLIRARDEIREKDKVIIQLTTQLMELRLILEKHEVEISSEGSEDENNSVTDHSDYFEWFDKKGVDGWPKETLIRARDEIREKDKVINQLTTQLMELCLELEKHEVEISSEGSEDEKNSVESDHKRRTDHNDYFEWFDKGVVDGWPKETLIRARDEIREKDKVINHLTTQLMELRLELEKHEVEISSEGSEDENNSVTDHNDYLEWFDKKGVDGWPKETLIRARDEIREKDKVINQLTTQLMELRLELEKHEVEISSEGSEDEKNFVESDHKRRTDHNDYFEWFDKGVVDGWPKETLIRARNEIREKDKVINHLTTQLMELRLELEKHEVEISSEGSEDENNSVTDHNDYFEWFDKGVVDGWPKETLIRARNEIREKDKVINHLTTQLMELRLELEKHEVEISSEGSEDENNSVTDHNDYLEWFDKKGVDGWPKETLIRARDEIREKDKVINQLTTQLMELRLELEKHEVEISSEGSEDEKNSVESDHKVGWMKKILGKMSISNA